MKETSTKKPFLVLLQRTFTTSTQFKEQHETSLSSFFVLTFQTPSVATSILLLLFHGSALNVPLLIRSPEPTGTTDGRFDVKTLTKFLRTIKKMSYERLLL